MDLWMLEYSHEKGELSRETTALDWARVRDR